MKSTNVEQFLADLGGGVFQEQLSQILSEVGVAVIENGASGKVVIELGFKQIAQSHQVAITHNLKYERPTKYGSITEKAKEATPMYVGSGGALTFFPEKQGQMFDKVGAPAHGEDRFPVDKSTGEIMSRQQ